MVSVDNKSIFFILKNFFAQLREKAQEDAIWCRFVSCDILKFLRKKHNILCLKFFQNTIYSVCTG